MESYRGASSDLKKIATKVLKGEYSEKVIGLLNLIGGGNASSNSSSSSGINVADTIGNFINGLIKK